MRVEILGEERRRRWSDEKKLEIVMSVGIDGATVTEVAQRHDVTRQQIYTWWRELRRKGLLLPSAGPVFLPVDMSVARSTPGMRRGCRGLVRHGRTAVMLRTEPSLNKDIEAAILAQLIRADEAVMIWRWDCQEFCA